MITGVTERHTHTQSFSVFLFLNCLCCCLYACWSSLATINDKPTPSAPHCPFPSVTLFSWLPASPYIIPLCVWDCIDWPFIYFPPFKWDTKMALCFSRASFHCACYYMCGCWCLHFFLLTYADPLQTNTNGLLSHTYTQILATKETPISSLILSTH